MKALCEDAGLEAERCKRDARGIPLPGKLGAGELLWRKLSGVGNLARRKLGPRVEAAFAMVTIARRPLR